MFWIIEAKSPKDILSAKDYKNIVQGAQYCIHPEIQAKYLLLCNGLWLHVYDPYGAIFFNKDLYSPIMSIKQKDLVERWPEVYQLLSVEFLRQGIEDDLKQMYEKLSLSSLNSQYPLKLINRIGCERYKLSHEIKQNVRKIRGEEIINSIQQRVEEIAKLNSIEILSTMQLPLVLGPPEGKIFVDKAIQEKMDENKIFSFLTNNFQFMGVFWKEQSFCGLCYLHNITKNSETKSKILKFLDSFTTNKMNICTRVECAYLRIIRKLLVILHYPELQAKVEESLKYSPEFIKYVKIPSVLGEIVPYELMTNQHIQNFINSILPDKLTMMLKDLKKIEVKIDKLYNETSKKLPETEIQINSFDSYGVGGYHQQLTVIRQNYKC
jgi:hypothetical protein